MNDKLQKSSGIGPLLQPDTAITSETEDKFSIHSSYARTIFKICSECPTPFVIGLFGRWGTGKTSIVLLLKKRLQEQQAKFRFVNIDVWKFTHEPLRRSILFEIESQLGEFDPQFKPFIFEKHPLRAHLDYSHHWNETATRFDRTFLSALFVAGVVLVLVALGLIWGLKLLGISDLAMTTLLGIAWGAVVSAGLWSILTSGIGWLVKNRKSTIFVEEVTKYSAQPTYSADQFSKLFNEMVKQATQDKRRLVICFDNLDRCDEKTALEAFSVIKTFLEVPNTVYVIPCDEEGIVNHIISGFSSTDRNVAAAMVLSPEDTIISQSNPQPIAAREQAIAREFLRKFFQSSIRIPPLLGEDVEVYLDDILRDALLVLPAEAKQVILVAFEGKTPRQLKRFINDFISYKWLAEELEGRHSVASGELTGDLARLAKLVVLYSEWPEVVERWSRDPYRWSETDSNLKQSQRPTVPLPDGLIKFLRATMWVEIPADLTAVLHLKRAAFESDPTLRGKVRSALSFNDVKAFTELTQNYERNVVVRLVRECVERLVGNSYYLFCKNALLVLVAAAPAFGDATIFDDNLEKLFSSLLLRNLYPDQAQLTEYQSTFDTLVDLLDRLSPERRSPFANWIVNAFRQNVSTVEGADLLVRLIGKPDVLYPDQRREIGNMLATGMHANPNPGSEKVVLFLENSGTLGLFASPSLAESILRRINFAVDTKFIWVQNAYVQTKVAASEQTKEFLRTLLRDNAVRQDTPESTARIEFLRKLEPADLGCGKTEEFLKTIKGLLEIIRGSEELQRWLPIFAQVLHEKPPGFQELAQRLSAKISALSPKAMYELFHSLDHLTFTRLKSSPYTAPLLEKISPEP
jgi:hypothetical protein